MKVHIKQIPIEGKQIEGEADNAILELNEPDLSAVGPVTYALEVGLSDGGLFATGQLGVDLQMRCVTCLENFIRQIRIENFACQIELTAAEMVDLTPQVREDILLALPAHPHCDWDGLKECKPPFDLRTPVSDSSSEAREVWDALDQLKIKKTN